MNIQSETTLATLRSSRHFPSLHCSVTTSEIQKFKTHREPHHVCSSTFNKIEATGVTYYTSIWLKGKTSPSSKCSAHSHRLKLSNCTSPAHTPLETRSRNALTHRWFPSMVPCGYGHAPLPQKKFCMRTFTRVKCSTQSDNHEYGGSTETAFSECEQVQYTEAA